jgi:hypothetical protein
MKYVKVYDILRVIYNTMFAVLGKASIWDADFPGMPIWKFYGMRRNPMQH